MATILNLQPNSAVLHKMSDEEKRHALSSYHTFKEFTNISTQHLFKCNYLNPGIVFTVWLSVLFSFADTKVKPSHACETES